MVCPSCGHNNPEDATFCGQCGSSLQEVACGSCGRSNPVEAKFCHGCGQALTADVASRTHTPAPSATLPTSFSGGRYRVQRFLGEGGRKRVYLAHDTRLDRDVAIAMIKTEGLDAEGLTRVRREAQAMARLGDHPHIVTVYDIGDEEGQPYIVSQYMGGGDLDGLLRQAEGRRLPLDRAVEIANNVREALEHAHSRGIIHRDLKPGNIWLTDDGTAQLGDFGLAVALDRSRLTMEGMMVGTVAYMPPEQALGRPPDARSDLYSWACVFYEMLTGRPPFLGDDSVAVISQHINTAPVAPSWHNPEVPKALEALILRCLAKDPEERPANAATMPEAMDAIMATAATVAEQTTEEVNPLDRLAGGVFVGREREMDELRAGLEDSLSGRGRLLMLVGEPGIGKTRTSEELATYASLRNVRILWGRCYEGEGAPSYWPWVQVVRSYVHDRDPRELMSEMGPGAADIAEVVSEVRERLPGLPTPPALEPEQARFRLFDSITTFLKNAGNRQPIVLVLDDLHWADKPSLLLLQFLARELRGARLMVLATYRDVELRRQHPLSQTLGELAREGLSHRILLRGLTQRDVSRFIEITSGISPPEALVATVYQETEGNPFFVNEIVRLLVADGRLEHPEQVTSWSVTIPQGVREVVGRRLDHLSEECNRVLTVGSVIGREFGLSILEKVSDDVSGDRLLEALEEAVGARVIVEKLQSVDEYSFSHALIRETLYEELSTARRVRLHRRIGEVLEEQEGANLEASLPQLAYHFSEAAQGGDVGKAIDYATKAAVRAMSLLAYEEAAAHYERGIQVLELQEPVDEQQRCDLLLAMGDAQFKAGDTPGAKQSYEQAAGVARGLADPDRLARAILGYGQDFLVGATEEKVVALLEEALTALPDGDSALRARLMSRLGSELYFSREQKRHKQLSVDAVEMARRVGDPATTAYTLWTRFFAAWFQEPDTDWLAIADEMVELALESGDKQREMIGRHLRINALLNESDIATVDREIETYDKLAQELRQPAFLWQAGVHAAMRALLEGRYEEGQRLAQQALAIGQRAQDENASQMFGAQVFSLSREFGGLNEAAIQTIRNFADQYPAVPAWRCAVALGYMDIGKMEEAKAEFETLAADDFASFPRDGNMAIALAILSEVCGFLGDARRAEILYNLLNPVAAGRAIVTGAAALYYGAADRSLGLLATARERWDEAEQHFLKALEMETRMGARPWLAWAQHHYAAMLLARDAESDREKALDLVAHALDTAQELGMKRLTGACLELKLQAQGISSTDMQTSIDAVAAAVYVDKPDLRSHSAPDGTVTILFSDIEGSTAMTERLGDQRWMELLREHNRIVRERVAAQGGYEVKSEGDGFMLAFQSARKALECAVDIQRAFAEWNGSAEEPIKVRMGLHTGEPVKEGADFFGKDVNLAARIAAQAGGGEIVVSSLLKELTQGGGDVVFGEGREVELKGLAGSHRVFEVRWE